MSRNRPQLIVPNGEHHDQIPPGRGSTEKLPAFLAAYIFRGDDRVRPLGRFFDFRRANSMPVNMADIVHIPIGAFYGVQHSYSIYSFCIYCATMPHISGHFHRPPLLPGQPVEGSV